MPGLIGKKIGMTTIFSEEGKNIPCTILEVGPVILDVKALSCKWISICTKLSSLLD